MKKIVLFISIACAIIISTCGNTAQQSAHLPPENKHKYMKVAQSYWLP